MSSRPSSDIVARNRLTIADLLLWMLGSGIVLAFYRSLGFNDYDDDRLGRVWTAYSLGFSLLLGAQIGSAFMFALRRMRGVGSFPTQPGHWLLLIEGISALLSGLGYVAARLGSQSPHLWGLTQLPNFLVTAALYGVGARVLYRESGLWRATLLLFMVQHAVGAVLFALVIPIMLADWQSWGWDAGFRLQSCCFPPIIGILLLLAAGMDRCRKKRDFLHWAGIVSVLGTSLLQESFVLVWSYFLR